MRRPETLSADYFFVRLKNLPPRAGRELVFRFDTWCSIGCGGVQVDLADDQVDCVAHGREISGCQRDSDLSDATFRLEVVRLAMGRNSTAEGFE